MGEMAIVWTWNWVDGLSQWSIDGALDQSLGSCSVDQVTNGHPHTIKSMLIHRFCYPFLFTEWKWWFCTNQYNKLRFAIVALKQTKKHCCRRACNQSMIINTANFMNSKIEFGTLIQFYQYAWKNFGKLLYNKEENMYYWYIYYQILKQHYTASAMCFYSLLFECQGTQLFWKQFNYDMIRPYITVRCDLHKITKVWELHDRPFIAHMWQW